MAAAEAWSGTDSSARITNIPAYWPSEAAVR
jgi:hypothetical protein